MSSSSPVHDSARMPPFMRMPDELLDKLFDHIFAGLQRKPLREVVRVYASLSLVCRAWQRVTVPFAYNTVILDVVKDAGAIAFLDPVGGAGAHLLKLVKTIELNAFKPLTKAPWPGEEAKEEKGGEYPQASPARTAPRLHGLSDDETSALPVATSVARILAECSNLSALTIGLHLESVLRKVMAGDDPSVMWPKLTHLNFTWDASFIDLLPVIARLSHLQTVAHISLLLVTGDENDDSRGTMTEELVDNHPIQPLEHLQTFAICLVGETAIGSKAVLQLLSPRAPLQLVQWGGYIPPGMCKQLSYGTSEIELLAYTRMQVTSNLMHQLLPQLLELGRCAIKRLVLEIEPHVSGPLIEFMPPITEILKNLPYSIRFSRAVDKDSFLSTLGFKQCFPTGGADFAAIEARPTASMTFKKDYTECDGSFHGKPLLQVGFFYVERETQDADNLCAFGRFGDPNVEGDVTDWMLLNVGFEDDGEEEEEDEERVARACMMRA